MRRADVHRDVTNHEDLLVRHVPADDRLTTPDGHIDDVGTIQAGASVGTEGEPAAKAAALKLDVRRAVAVAGDEPKQMAVAG